MSTCVQSYFDAFNAVDIDGMVACLTDDVAHHVNEGEIRRGTAEFRAFCQHMNRTYREELTDMVIFQNGDRAAAEFLLSNMPTRLADSLREEMAEAGDIRQSDAERAMAAVITQVREMEDAGDLSLIAPDEGAAEAA